MRLCVNEDFSFRLYFTYLIFLFFPLFCACLFSYSSFFRGFELSSLASAEWRKTLQYYCKVTL